MAYAQKAQRCSKQEHTAAAALPRLCTDKDSKSSVGSDKSVCTAARTRYAALNISRVTKDPLMVQRFLYAQREDSHCDPKSNAANVYKSLLRYDEFVSLSEREQLAGNLRKHVFLFLRETAIEPGQSSATSSHTRARTVYDTMRWSEYYSHVQLRSMFGGESILMPRTLWEKNMSTPTHNITTGSAVWHGRGGIFWASFWLIPANKIHNCSITLVQKKTFAIKY